MHVRPTRLAIGAGTLAASALFGLFAAIPTAPSVRVHAGTPSGGAQFRAGTPAAATPAVRASRPG